MKKRSTTRLLMVSIALVTLTATAGAASGDDVGRDDGSLFAAQESADPHQLVESPAFLEARAVFDGSDEEFLKRVDYQLRFRASYDFLSSDPAYVASVMAAPVANESVAELGLKLTDGEYAENERRAELRAQEIEIKRMVTGRSFDESEEAQEIEGRLGTGPVFAGIWQDHLDSGVLKLAVVQGSAIDRSALYALVPGGADDLVVIEQRYSRDELEEWKELINKRLRESGMRGATGYDFSEVGVRIEVTPGLDDAELKPLVDGIPSDAYVIGESAVPKPLGAPHVQHALADLQSGLYIGVGLSSKAGCTWGATGHTSSYAYIVTAGHCVTGAGTKVSGWGIAEVVQGAGSTTVISTTPSAYTYANNLQDDRYDHARVSSPYANTNCYHSDQGHCYWTITRRLSLYGHESGDQVCASLGSRNMYECGDVHNPDWDGYDADGHWHENLVQVNMDSDQGDSGAGMKWEYTLHGTVSLGAHDILIWHYTWFEPAYYVKSGMGSSQFDFNCVRSGSWWGSCPVVMD